MHVVLQCLNSNKDMIRSQVNCLLLLTDYKYKRYKERRPTGARPVKVTSTVSSSIARVSKIGAFDGNMTPSSRDIQDIWTLLEKQI